MRRLGKAFGDNLLIEKRKPRHGSDAHFTGWGVRLTIFYGALLMGMFLLAVRLFHLTIVRGRRYRMLSQNNRIREVVIHAPRGILFDRKGQALTRNVPAYRLLAPCEHDESIMCATILSQGEVFTMETGEIEKGLLEIDVVRQYLYPEEFAHVLGYLTEITSDELADHFYAYQGYRLGDRIGRIGVEKSWESNLRGTDGKELIEVDADGRRLRVLGEQAAIPGKNITMSLDLDLQRVAYEALGDSSGVVIATIPKTGEILSLVSKPSFDTNKLQKELSQEEFEVLVQNPDKPMFNRAIGGLYPPGSTFKIVTATAALEEGAIDEDTRVEDVGVLKVGIYSYGNWYFSQYGKTEGQVDIIKAIARSNDIFFYKTGEWVGIKNLANWGKRFGLGALSGIEIDGEASGVMPDPAWRQENRGQEWFLGDTYHVAIGQGDLQTTPLQVNRFTNVVASGGRLCKPLLEKQESSLPAQTGSKSQVCKDLKISKETLEIVQEGMRRACDRGLEETYRGTGWPLFDFDPPVACKTGTAEFNDPDDATHAWFTAFAPIDDPEISVTVLLEAGGEGSSDAGPVAKKVLEEWFNR